MKNYLGSLVWNDVVRNIFVEGTEIGESYEMTGVNINDYKTRGGMNCAGSSRPLCQFDRRLLKVEPEEVYDPDGTAQDFEIFLVHNPYGEEVIKTPKGRGIIANGGRTLFSPEKIEIDGKVYAGLEFKGAGGHDVVNFKKDNFWHPDRLYLLRGGFFGNMETVNGGVFWEAAKLEYQINHQLRDLGIDIPPVLYCFKLPEDFFDDTLGEIKNVQVKNRVTEMMSNGLGVCVRAVPSSIRMSYDVDLPPILGVPRHEYESQVLKKAASEFKKLVKNGVYHNSLHRQNVLATGEITDAIDAELKGTLTNLDVAAMYVNLETVLNKLHSWRAKEYEKEISLSEGWRPQYDCVSKMMGLYFKHDVTLADLKKDLEDTPWLRKEFEQKGITLNDVGLYREFRRQYSKEHPFEDVTLPFFKEVYNLRDIDKLPPDHDEIGTVADFLAGDNRA